MKSFRLFWSAVEVDTPRNVGVASGACRRYAVAVTGGFFGMGKLWDGAFGVVNRLMGDD